MEPMSKRHPGSRHHARLHKGRWETFRREIFERDGWRCVICGKAGRLEAHHIKPLEDGGEPFAMTNTATYCRDCHIASHRPPPRPGVEAWRTLLRELVDTP